MQARLLIEYCSWAAPVSQVAEVDIVGRAPTNYLFTEMVAECVEGLSDLLASAFFGKTWQDLCGG